MILFLTGGFLGSGKTTAIQQACMQLMNDGIRVGVVTNDQGAQQVDGAFISSFGIPAREVGNGCFCCNYKQLNDSLISLKLTDRPEAIFAESVGSCTDLVATVVNPLQRFHPEIKIVVSVFADARLLQLVLKGLPCFFDNSVRYIYQQQLAEADILVVNKTDLLLPEELALLQQLVAAQYPGKKALYQNSLSAASVRQWLDAMDNFQLPAYRSSLQVDYDIYGAGEARLAWLDQSIRIDTDNGAAANNAVTLINHIFEQVQAQALPVGHLKFLLNDGQQQRKISFTLMDRAAYKPEQPLPAGNSAEVLINARVETGPQQLQQIVAHAVNALKQQAGCRITVQESAAFQPGYPTPTHRIFS